MAPGREFRDGEIALPAVVAECLGGQVTAAQVERFAAFPLYRRRAEVVTLACRQFDIDFSNPLVLRRLASSRGVTVDELMASNDAEAEPPSQAEVESTALARYGNADPVSQMKVRLALEAISLSLARMRLLERIRSETEGDCALSLPPAPRVQLGDDLPESSRLRVAFFGSFRCRHCPDSWRAAENLRQRWGDRVRFELWHHFPAGSLEWFRDAVEAECSLRNGQLWDYVRFRLDRDPPLPQPNRSEGAGASSAVFDPQDPKFIACTGSPEVAVKVLSDAEWGLRMGFRNAMPSWVIGRQPRRGFQGEGTLDEAIAGELKQED